jgi:hypothetical protein
MKVISLLALSLLFSLSIQGQVLPDLTKLAKELVEYDHPNFVSSKVVYDSIIEITYHENLK